MPNCKVCNKQFDDYELLAHHIIQSKGLHRKGRVWATKFLATYSLSAKAKRGNDLENRTPMTEEQKEARRNLVRELSGQMKWVTTICPKCRTKNQVRLEAEFVDNPLAWRISGVLVRLCDDCR